jgi:hypothetical protein
MKKKFCSAYAKVDVGGNFFPLSHTTWHGRSAPGGSIQIVIHATNESTLCENFF